MLRLPDRVVYLVLCSHTDAPALWAYERLRAVGLVPIELVTPASLALAETWEHELGTEGVHLKLDLGDGRVVSSAKIQGVLNRLLSTPQDLVNRAVAEDRDYAGNEIGAFYLSWLSALPGVINRPTPQGLPGSWRHASEWTLLAGRAGLHTVPYRQSSISSPENGYASLAPLGANITSVIVFENQLYGAPVPFQARDACRKLADSAKTELLGVDLFDSGNGTVTFAHATPFPDLTLGGNELIDALARSLRSDHGR